jgi:hypothetical protein
MLGNFLQVVVGYSELVFRRVKEEGKRVKSKLLKDMMWESCLNKEAPDRQGFGVDWRESWR